MIEHEMIHGTLPAPPRAVRKDVKTRFLRRPVPDAVCDGVNGVEGEIVPAARRNGRRVARIEEDTPITPRAVAEAVWEEACVWLEEELPRHWVVLLTKRADVIYHHSGSFRRLLRKSGNAGRDWLWAFTRHWLSGLIWKHRWELHGRLPPAYSVGHELPGSPRRTAPARPLVARTTNPACGSRI